MHITNIMTQPELMPFILLAVVSMSEYVIFLPFVIDSSASLYRNRYMMGPDLFLAETKSLFQFRVGNVSGLHDTRVQVGPIQIRAATFDSSSIDSDSKPT